MTIKKLPSGFWHVTIRAESESSLRPKWPEAALRRARMTNFTGFAREDKEDAAQQAAQAVKDRKETR